MARLSTSGEMLVMAGSRWASACWASRVLASRVSFFGSSGWLKNRLGGNGRKVDLGGGGGGWLFFEGGLGV